MDLTKLIRTINAKNRIPRLLFMIIGVFLLALNYNLFFLQNDLVVGGVGGLAIVFNALFGWNTQIFIYIASILLLIISFIFLGVEKTKPAIIGSILYPIFISFTAPLASLLSQYIVFNEYLVMILCTSFIYGFASGLIYKMGYNCGGSDIIMLIMQKYLHMSEGKATFISSLVIILLGGVTLGINKVIYAIIIVYITGVIVDKMLIGISKSKLFIIQTSKESEVKDAIVNEFHLGVTVLEAIGGYSNKREHMLMCVLPTRDYYMFKEVIKTIDPDAFIIVDDCYDTEGGTTKMKSIGLNSLT